MKHCGARPYKGLGKYIFISYSHKDIALVFPIIERLVKDGYRVWYDEGIDPGTEWPETIAKKLKGCEVCIPMMSKNSLQSRNCDREITYALSLNKKLFPVMLEELTLPDGLQMQLSVVQWASKYSKTEEEFFESIYEPDILRPCLGSPNPSIRVSGPEDYVEDGSKALGATAGLQAENSGNRKEEQGGTAARGGKKEARANGWRKYLPPGFRTGNPLHMLVGFCYYIMVILSMFISEGESLLEIMAYRVFFVRLFLGCAVIWGNYLNCWEKMPLMKSRAGRLLGFMLYPTLIFMALCMLLLLVLLPTYTA